MAVSGSPKPHNFHPIWAEIPLGQWESEGGGWGSGRIMNPMVLGLSLTQRAGLYVTGEGLEAFKSGLPIKLTGWIGINGSSAHLRLPHTTIVFWRLEHFEGLYCPVSLLRQIIITAGRNEKRRKGEICMVVLRATAKKSIWMHIWIYISKRRLMILD